MSDMQLSDAINTLVRTFRLPGQMRDDETFAMSGKEARQIHHVLQMMETMARDMELELGCYRDIEAEKARRRAIDDEAGQTLGDMLLEAGGKVVRPDFGRKQ